MFNTGIAFSKSLLRHITYQICFGAVSFESSAGIYNASSEKLNPKRLEAAWFIYKILSHVNTLTWHRSQRKEVDIEKICLDVYEKVSQCIDEKWLSHVCEEIGCKNRYVVIDGNEKMFRLICNADKTKIIGGAGNINKYQLCIRDPVRGNQYQEASKLCHLHMNGKSTNVVEKIDFKRITRSMDESIPEVISSGEGCKEDKNIERFHTRTAGMMYFYRSCGIRLSHWEMFTSESLSLVVSCLIDLFGVGNNSDDIKGIVYDRACELHPFISRLSSGGNLNVATFVNIPYIVDIFHAEKHSEPKCTLTHPDCFYHPHLEKFSNVRKMNTEVTEQSFSRINPFKFMTRRMSYGRRLLFLKFLDDHANNHIMKDKNM